MKGKYKIGSRSQVIKKMARYAIRDQESLLDALTPQYGEPDETTAIAIQDVKDCISDFMRIRNLNIK